MMAGITLYIILLFSAIQRKYIKESNRFGDMLGTQVKINDDTLMVVDYRLFAETLCLDNGLGISIKLYEQTVIKDTLDSYQPKDITDYGNTSPTLP
jgi:hypothetical protein